MTELDITSEITNLVINERLNDYHTATATLRNTGKQFNDTESDYDVMKRPKVSIVLGNRQFKFTIERPQGNVTGDTVQVQMASHSFDLKGAIAQIRVQNAEDGNYYLEDVLYKALYDTGQQNFFLIKLQNGEYYTPKSPPEHKIKIDAIDDVVYTRISVYDILIDLCSKSGVVWYEEDLADNDSFSIINLLKIESEYDVAYDNILYVSTANNATSVNPTKGYDTLSNLIYFDKLPFAIVESESVQRYGIRNPRKITYDEDAGDVSKHIKAAFALRSIVKDPIVNIPIAIPGIIDIESLRNFVKVVDSTGDYDRKAGMDKMYRIISATYDLDADQTTLTIGNDYRNLMEERLQDLTKGNVDMEESNETQNIEKGVLNDCSPLRFQVYTDGSKHDDTFTHTSGSYGVRMGIDYLYHATYSPNAKFYMENDGVRTGN